MKSEFDKEIDSLLRRSLPQAARPGGAAARGGAPESAATQHLDADELSAYAENALLPAATRARYTAHLADCARCRKIVASVSLAAGAAGELEKSAAAALVKTTPASSWRAWLAALFAPRMLGYALPLLALGLVGVIAFFATQRRSGTGLLTAQHENADANTEVAGKTDTTDTTATTAATNTSETTTNTDTKTTTTTTATTSANTATGDAPTMAPRLAGASDAEAEKAGGAPASGPTADDRAAKAVTQETVQVSPARAGEAPQATGANSNFVFGSGAAASPPPVKAPAPAEVAGRSRAANNRSDAALAENAKSAEEDEAKRAEPRRRAATPDGSRNEPSTRAPKSKVESSRRGMMMKREQSENSQKADGGAAHDAAVAETRSAAGRKFRRQGGAWVDVSYNSSMRIARSVRRGTDQFRALAADLPELERIANQLQGEVIAVVGGRAYRIR